MYETQEVSKSPEAAAAEAYREAFINCLQGKEMTEEEKNEAADKALGQHRKGNLGIIDFFRKDGLNDARKKAAEVYETTLAIEIRKKVDSQMNRTNRPAAMAA